MLTNNNYQEEFTYDFIMHTYCTREKIFLYHSLGLSIRRIERLIKKAPSIVMREIKRNTSKFKSYASSLAKKSYRKNKRKG
ncbi:helix-turn-helix domain-containing protein [Enterococcus gallinarum]|nr:helix-turn-helix domain-containing protein [Enterococcus gallinarum]